MLITFIALYLLASIGIGIYAASRVNNTADYAVAGRSLPLPVIIATTFATWFGAETVLGISGTFAKEGLRGVIEDPFGSSLCLVFVGLFFAARLYRMHLITIGDYYRRRYGSAVEVITAIVIILSYLGWVAAQIKALGIVFHLLAPDLISEQAGMILGMLIVLGYTLFGGMWSVALTDFFQMCVIAIGLVVVAWYATDMAGGVGHVITVAKQKDLFRILPDANFKDIAFFMAAALTMMLGSIPQQDVFQRVMSSKDEKTAVRGPVIGGTLYFIFAFIPMFIVLAALKVMPEAAALLDTKSSEILPTLVRDKMPLFAQVMFFGALLSAIMSTASATILAPSITFTENIFKHIAPNLDDKHFLRATRITVVVFTLGVLAFALSTTDSIYEMVKNAYKVTLVGAFIPLAMGVYWRRATTQGALLSMASGIFVWLVCEQLTAEIFPAQLAGLIAAFVGMILGSLLPQFVKDTRGHVHHYEGSTSVNA
jgi:SSS family transporter